MNRRIEVLEKEAEALRKINRVLMERVENAVNSTGSGYAIFEQNILLQKRVEARTAELEQINQRLAGTLEEQKRIAEGLRASERRAALQRSAIANLMVDQSLVQGGRNPFMRKTVEILSRTIGVERASIWLLSDDRAQLICQTLYDARSRAHTGGAILETKSFPAYFRAIQAEARIFVEDAQTDHRTKEMTESYLKPRGIVSLLDTGILVEGELRGILCLEHVGPMRKWHSDEESFSAALAALVAQLLVNDDRKRAEAALRAKTNELDRYFSSALDLLCIVDMEGHFIRVNKEWEHMLGCSVEDLEKRTFLEFVHPDDMSATMEVLAKLREQEKVLNFTNRVHSKDGSYRDIEWRSSPQEGLIYAAARDITDRKRMETELRESEMRFKTLHNASFGGIAIHDKGLILDCNQGLSDITGYSMDELVGMDGRLLISPGTRDGVVANIQAFCETPYEAVGVRKNGEEFPLRIVAREIPYKGKAVRVFEFRDITEQKNAEAALQRSESRYRTLVNNSGDIAQIIDAQGKTSYVSSQVEAILGYSPSEILAMDSVLTRIHPDDFSAVTAAFQSCLVVPGAKSRVECRYRHKGGHWIWLEVAGSNLLHDPFVGGLFLIIQDITMRKQAEEARLESEEKLRALFASMTEMVAMHEVVMDRLGQPANYRITDCNRVFTELTGIARESAVGRLATDVYGTPVAPYLEEYSRVAFTGKSYAFETYFPPLDKHFSISVVSLGKNRFATISADITAAKKNQYVIATKNKELEQLVYVASHDLRSPLVNVDGYGRELEYVLGEIIQILEFEEEPAAKLEAMLRTQLPDITAALRHIRNSTRQMDGLLKGLLKLSRMGRAALSIGPIEMNLLLARVVSTLQFQIREAGADLRMENLPPCRGDEVQVAQVFSNLISNALKFRDPARPSIIAIGGAVEQGRSVYFVGDNGIGIPPEHREKVFELFHRLDPTKTEGDGMGLTIVRQILGRLDGEIWIESTPGEGSRFYVALPRDRASKLENTEEGR